MRGGGGQGCSLSCLMAVWVICYSYSNYDTYEVKEGRSQMTSSLSSSFQVHALYDFEAQPDTGELSLTAGDILTVTRTDVGEGWWEGQNARGEIGLFPEAYVEVISFNIRCRTLERSLFHSFFNFL